MERLIKELKECNQNYDFGKGGYFSSRRNIAPIVNVVVKFLDQHEIYSTNLFNLTRLKFEPDDNLNSILNSSNNLGNSLNSLRNYIIFHIETEQSKKLKRSMVEVYLNNLKDKNIVKFFIDSLTKKYNTM